MLVWHLAPLFIQGNDKSKISFLEMEKKKKYVYIVLWKREKEAKWSLYSPKRRGPWKSVGGSIGSQGYR